jgi:hypothetical protein
MPITSLLVLNIVHGRPHASQRMGEVFPSGNGNLVFEVAISKEIY